MKDDEERSLATELPSFLDETCRVHHFANQCFGCVSFFLKNLKFGSIESNVNFLQRKYFFRSCTKRELSRELSLWKKRVILVTEVFIAISSTHFNDCSWNMPLQYCRANHCAKRPKHERSFFSDNVVPFFSPSMHQRSHLSQLLL